MVVPARHDLTVCVGGLAMGVCNLPMSVSDFIVDMDDLTVGTAHLMLDKEDMQHSSEVGQQ